MNVNRSCHRHDLIQPEDKIDNLILRNPRRNRISRQHVLALWKQDRKLLLEQVNQVLKRYRHRLVVCGRGSVAALNHLLAEFGAEHEFVKIGDFAVFVVGL